jgi:uncharacterized membrane protein YraQ (UPF0718 family)
MPSPFLFLTLAALAAGPALYAAARSNARVLAFLDGFVLVSIAGLVVLEVVPGTFMEGGAWSLAFLLAGLFGPTLLERVFREAEREAHLAALALAVVGLVVHALGDGVVLAPNGKDWALPAAVVVHSVPVGMAVWWLLAPAFGTWPPLLVLLAMGAGTVAGYRYGVSLNAMLSPQAWAWFQSLVAGTILHVIFGRPHLHGEHDDPHHAHEERRTPREAVRYEGIGNILALVSLVFVSVIAAETSSVGARFMDLALESAPALLVAYLIGGFVYGELPEAVVRWLSSGGRASQALRGTALGLPLPICSCSVLPLYRSLVTRGVPAASGLAFLIAAPEVGLTALLVSLPLLGLEMTLVRVAAAAGLAIVVGYFVTAVLSDRTVILSDRPVILSAAKNLPGKEILRSAQDDRGCCDHDHAPAPPANRWHRALRAGFVDLVDGTAPWIVLGIVMAAVAEPMLTQMLWAQWPDMLEVLVFAVVGMPLYVCAAGATPLVAVLLAAGVSPGAALAFLLTGPATNVATFGLLRSLHGRRLAWVFAVVTAAGAVALGMIVNALPLAPPQQVVAQHEHATPLQMLSLAALTLLYVGSLLRRGGRAFLAELFDAGRPAEAH